MTVTEQREGSIRFRALGDQKGPAFHGICQRPTIETERFKRGNHFIRKVGAQRIGRIGFLTLRRTGNAPRKDALKFTAVEIGGGAVNGLLSTHAWFSNGFALAWVLAFDDPDQSGRPRIATMRAMDQVLT